MTIKNITVSAVAATLLTTAAVAATGEGTLTYVGGSGTSTTTYTIAKELLDFADQNATNVAAVANKLQYQTGTIPNGSITEPAITLKLTGGTFAGTTWSDINISDATTGDTIATYKAGAGTAELALEPYANGSITSGEDLNITSAAGDIELALGSSGASLEVVIGYSTDPSTADSGSATIIDSVVEYTAAVTSAFDNKIDASNAFQIFTTPATPSTTTDSATITLTAATANIDLAVGATTLTQVINSDVNTSVYLTAGTVEFLGGADGGTIALNDMNTSDVDGAPDTIADADTIVSVYTTTLTTAIDVTDFTVDLTHVSATIGTVSLLSNEDIGSWAIYGYTAQIPNVSGLLTHNTTMKFTNSSSTDAEIYFTLIDPDGTTVTLDSVNDGLTTLTADTTGTYKASALVALVDDADFDATGSFSVEVAIPTTPNSVYGMASFKNTTLGQFKDLPVYNSSTMGY